MLSYRAILKQAWKISWKHKFLWFFGFFASLVSFSTEFKVISRAINQNQGIQSLNNIKMFLNTGIFSKTALLNILEMFRTNPLTIILLILMFLLILAIIAFFAWLSTASQIGIISSIDKIIKERKEKLSIRSGIKIGNKKFWPVFIVNTLTSILINLIYLLISFLLVLVIIKNQSMTTILYGFIFIIFIPITLLISFVIKYAVAFMIIENKKFFTAIKQGWLLFKNNWLISVEVAIILFFINILAIILISTICFVGFFVFFGLAISSVFIVTSGFLFWTIIILSALVLIVFMALSGAILNVFQITSWTDLFLQLRKNGGESKIERIFEENK